VVIDTLVGTPKITSALRRLSPTSTTRYVEASGLEGHACVFEVDSETESIIVESAYGRAMTLAPGDFFLATPGYRESTRWVVGGIPPDGLVPGGKYWILAESGVIGDLIGDSPLKKNHLAQVTYRGAAVDDHARIINLRELAVTTESNPADRGAPLFLILGTSAEVGKTTAGISVLRALRHKGHATITVLKATGTSAVTELLRYQDFGAAPVFDCVDFGLPTTYPSGREGMDVFFDRALDTVLSIDSGAVLVECGGDILGANVPVFLERMKRRRSKVTIVLAAADALGALGAKQVLSDMGLSISLITGPCTDTPTLQQRTQALCGISATNLAQGGRQNIF
jgi:hypothetical protein